MKDDSRFHKYPYLFRRREEVPNGFALAANDAESFTLGLFLPREEPDWFGRSAFPPRIALLLPGALLIQPYSSAKETSSRLLLDRFMSVESGHCLLLGWLAIADGTISRNLRYNTLGIRAVQEFFQKLRFQWLRPSNRPFPSMEKFGESLDLKFRNALDSELDPGEGILLSLFQRARRVSKGLGPFRYKSWVPADLFVVTPTRFLWITDRLNDGYEMYGTIVRYAGISAVSGVVTRPGKEKVDLEIQFCSGSFWNLPFHLRMAEDVENAARIIRMSISRNGET
jgi:hypothetical protein